MAANGADGRLASRWTPDELRAEVATRTWFHTIDLGDGVVTPGQKDTPSEWEHFRIPDVQGRSVLDIGAYDGFYSFEVERRGASRVVAADSWAWNWPGSDARRNFELAHEVLGSSVESVDVSVEALDPVAVGGTFDVVLFLGVLYHAPDPLGYLQAVRSVTKGVAVIETVVDMLDVDVPAAVYYPGSSLNNDGSNHFGPNPAAVKGWLEYAGFTRVEAFDPWWTNSWYAVVGHRPQHLLGRLWNRVRPPRPRSGRMVFHAYVDDAAPAR